MELLILLVLTVWGTSRYGANGALAYARKTEPLRIAERRQRAAQAHERAMARTARRSARPTPTIAEAISLRIADRLSNPRGGPAREAMMLWWADSWGYATERRRVRHQRAAEGQLGRQKAARALGGWIAAQWLHRTAQGTPTAPQAGRQASGHDRDRDAPIWADADIVDAELVEHEPAEQHPIGDDPDREEDTDDRARTTGSARDNETQTHPEATEHDQSTYPAPAERPAPSQPEYTERRLAPVHPIRKDISTMNPHTVTSGETLDPAAGLAFVSSVREAAEQLVSQIELSIASLTERGVHGEPITLLAQMQEAFAVAVNASTAAATHFERHLGVQDQVLSDPSLAGTVSGTYVGTRS
jgi:hypothetical protein